jgi:hypothetical protein
LLATSGSQVTRVVNEKSEQSFEPDHVLQAFSIYYLFVFLWTFDWFVAISQCTIAGAIATWYWTRDKKVVIFVSLQISPHANRIH